MPESMYDKLGDLLSKTLDSGIFFVNVTDKDKESYLSKKQEENNPEKESPQRNQKIRLSADFFEDFTKTNQKNYEILKFSSIPEKVLKALAFFNLDEKTTYEAAKKLYREKLMYFHPDKWNSNPVLQKISKEKTEMIIENWNILENWFQTKDSCQ